MNIHEEIRPMWVDPCMNIHEGRGYDVCCLFQVEQFWKYYSHIVRPSDLTVDGALHEYS